VDRTAAARPLQVSRLAAAASPAPLAIALQVELPPEERLLLFSSPQQTADHGWS
jgi:hypothetical protein